MIIGLVIILTNSLKSSYWLLLSSIKLMTSRIEAYLPSRPRAMNTFLSSLMSTCPLLLLSRESKISFSSAISLSGMSRDPIL